MKKFILLPLVISSFLSAQTNTLKNIAELKTQIDLQEISLMKEFSPDVVSQKKNAGLAILYSFLLPGMGELYAGSYESGKYFTIADGVFWGVFAGFNIYGNWQQNNYISFAKSFGGVELKGKDEDYYAVIGDYLDIDQYNRTQELNRNFSETLDPRMNYWKWDSNTQRKEYRNMWTSSEQAFNNIRFAAGALILNRIISAINAVRLVAAHNKKISDEISWKISFGVNNNNNLPSSLTVNFQTSF